MNNIISSPAFALKPVLSLIELRLKHAIFFGVLANPVPGTRAKPG
jgi:hypothetical protein